MEQTIKDLQENLRKRSNDVESLNKELEERNGSILESLNFQDEIERLQNEQRVVKRKLMQYWKVLSSRIDTEEFEEILNMNVDSDPSDIIDALMILQEAQSEKENSNQQLIKDLEEQLNRRNMENNQVELEKQIEMVKSLKEKDQLGIAQLLEQQKEMIKKLTSIESFEQKITQLDIQMKLQQEESNQLISTLNEEIDNMRQKEIDLKLKYQQKAEENEKQQELIETMLKLKPQKANQLAYSIQKADQLSQHSQQSLPNRKGYVNHSENPSPQITKKDLKFPSMHSHRPQLSNLMDSKQMKLTSAFDTQLMSPRIVLGAHQNDFKPFGQKKI